MGADIRILRGTTTIPYSTSASTVDTSISLTYPSSASVAPRWAFARLLSPTGYVQAENKDGNYMTGGCTAGDQSAVVSLVKPFLMGTTVYLRVEAGPATASFGGHTTQVDRKVHWEVWEFAGDYDTPNEIYIPGATPESEPLLTHDALNEDNTFTAEEAKKCVAFTRGISWTQETAGAGIPGGYTTETRYGSATIASINLFGDSCPHPPIPHRRYVPCTG